MSNQNQRFNFKTAKIISIAIAGIALMLLGRFIVQSLASTLWLNNAINGDAFVAVMNSELALSLVLRGVGVGLFLFSMYRAYVNRSTFTFKAFKKTLVLSSLLCLIVIMSSTVVEAPLAAADKMNTIAQGYKICISDGYYDYWIGQLSNNEYFAIRGSDGNAMTFVEPWQLSPPWAAYASNYTALEQQVLAAITSGTVYSKEVPFDYNLTIPLNVRFIENVNGLERNFVSSANSQGSPYTISQDTVNSGYYLVQDSQGRFINSWSSTNHTFVMQSAINALPDEGGKLEYTVGVYLLDVTVTGTRGLEIEGITRGAENSYDGVVFKWIGTTNDVMFDFYNQYEVNMRNVKINGDNIAGLIGVQLGGVSGGAFPYSRTRSLMWENVEFNNITDTALMLGKTSVASGTDDSSFKNMRFTNCGVAIDGGGDSASQDVFIENKIRNCTTGVILRDYSRLNFVSTVWAANNIDIDFRTNTTATGQSVAMLTADGCWFENAKTALFRNTGVYAPVGYWIFDNCYLNIAIGAELFNMTNFGSSATLDVNDAHIVSSGGGYTFPVIVPNNSGIYLSIHAVGTGISNLNYTCDTSSQVWSGLETTAIDIFNGNVTTDTTTAFTELLGSKTIYPVDKAKTLPVTGWLYIDWNPQNASCGIAVVDVTAAKNITVLTGYGLGRRLDIVPVTLLGSMSERDIMIVRTWGDGGTLSPKVWSIKLLVDT